MSKIYKLKLHEGTHIDDDLFVYRVPGGWIYHFDLNENRRSVFVPFNNEFQIVDSDE